MPFVTVQGIPSSVSKAALKEFKADIRKAFNATEGMKFLDREIGVHFLLDALDEWDAVLMKVECIDRSSYNRVHSLLNKLRPLLTDFCTNNSPDECRLHVSVMTVQ